MADQRIIPSIRYLDEEPPTDLGEKLGTNNNLSNEVDIDISGLGGGSTNNSDWGAVPHIYANSDYTLHDWIQLLTVYSFIVMAALSAIFIFIGGVSFVLSGGNDEKIKQAVNTIRYAIIGLIVSILSFTFVIIIGRMFGLDFMSYLSFEEITRLINNLFQNSQNNSPTNLGEY